MVHPSEQTDIIENIPATSLAVGDNLCKQLNMTCPISSTVIGRGLV